jgi:hypothetical protein
VERIKLRNRQNDRNAAKTRAKQSDKDREKWRIKIKNMYKRTRFSDTAANVHSVHNMTIRRTWRSAQLMLVRSCSKLSTLCLLLYSPLAWWQHVQIARDYHACITTSVYVKGMCTRLNINICSLMFVPCIAWLGIIDQNYALITLVNKILSHERFIVFLT